MAKFLLLGGLNDLLDESMGWSKMAQPVKQTCAWLRCWVAIASVLFSSRERLSHTNRVSRPGKLCHTNNLRSPSFRNACGYSLRDSTMRPDACPKTKPFNIMNVVIVCPVSAPESRCPPVHVLDSPLTMQTLHVADIC